VQYAAGAYVQRLEKAGCAISMADVGAAWQNGYAERLIRIIKEEEVYLSEYDDYHEAHQQLGRFLEDVYMHKRIHSSLGYLIPVEFEGQWRAGQQRPVLIPLKQSFLCPTFRVQYILSWSLSPYLPLPSFHRLAFFAAEPCPAKPR
jgi:hypothetical protein